MWTAIDRRDQQADEEIIDDTIQRIADTRKAVIVDEGQPFTVSGFPAREVELISLKSDSTVLRVIVAETRIYVLVAEGPTVDPADKVVRRFLDSFQITDAPRR
jgi:hypothetical protein